MEARGLTRAELAQRLDFSAKHVNELLKGRAPITADTAERLERVLGRGFSLEFLGSYLFDRQLFQGTNFSSGRIDQVRFDPGLGLSLQLLWRR